MGNAHPYQGAWADTWVQLVLVGQEIRVCSTNLGRLRTQFLLGAMLGEGAYMAPAW